jgi:hypothetical protein
MLKVVKTTTILPPISSTFAPDFEKAKERTKRKRKSHALPCQ